MYDSIFKLNVLADKLSLTAKRTKKLVRKYFAEFTFNFVYYEFHLDTSTRNLILKQNFSELMNNFFLNKNT